MTAGRAIRPGQSTTAQHHKNSSDEKLREQTMATTGFTLDALRRILREGAGADESVDLDDDILDVDFEALGYESLALLETGSRIEREYGITLDEDALATASTPRALIEAVNAQTGIAA